MPGTRRDEVQTKSADSAAVKSGTAAQKAAPKAAPKGTAKKPVSGMTGESLPAVLDMLKDRGYAYATLIINSERSFDVFLDDFWYVNSSLVPVSCRATDVERPNGVYCKDEECDCQYNQFVIHITPAGGMTRFKELEEKTRKIYRTILDGAPDMASYPELVSCLVRSMQICQKKYSKQRSSDEAFRKVERPNVAVAGDYALFSSACDTIWIADAGYDWRQSLKMQGAYKDIAVNIGAVTYIQPHDCRYRVTDSAFSDFLDKDSKKNTPE